MKIENILLVSTSSGENASVQARTCITNATHGSPHAGGCRELGCSCGSFVVKDRHNAQFCENCGHARSRH